MSAAPGRNEPCSCGSGKKYKRCCGGAGAPAKPLKTTSSAAAARAPGHAREELALGIARAHAGDDDGALAAYGRAAHLDGTLAEAFERAGDLLRRRKRLAEAAAAYDGAARAATGTTSALLYRAKASAARDRHVEARGYLEQLVRSAASTPADARAQAKAHLVLGHNLGATGRFDDAKASFERSMALWPRQPDAYHGLLTAKKVTEADRPVLDTVLRLLEEPDLAPRERMLLHFAAGKAFDDLRDHAAAIAQFDAANVIRRPFTRFDAQGVERLVDRFVARFTPAYFAENAALRGADETPVLVLGMPRSGTTLFERIVSSHPRVGGGGELPYWMDTAPVWVDTPVDELLAQSGRLRGDYLRVLRAVSAEALRVTDKAPANFMWIGFIHLLFPGARFVHCRRNPVDTCFSIYSTYFEEDWAFASSRADLVAFYRQYARIMDHWRRVIPADRLLDVDYEDAIAAPEPTARRLVAFCGLEWDDACLHPERNADMIRTASKWQARQPVYRTSVARWRNYEPWLGELRALLPPA